MDDKARQLREKALKILENRDKDQNRDSIQNDMHTLLEELSIYQVELELQNKELINSQQELIQARQEYQNLFNEAPVGFAITDDQLNILMVNKTLANMIRQAKDEIVKKPLNRIIHPDDQDRFYLDFEYPVKQLLPGKAVVRMAASTRPVYVLVTSNRFEQNGQDRLRISFTDVTSQTIAENKIREQEELLRQTEKLARIGGFSYHMTDGAFRMTDALMDMLADSNNENAPRVDDFLTIFSEKDQETLSQAMNLAIHDGNPLRLVLSTHHEGELKRWYQIIGKPVSLDGRREFIQGSVQDVTEIRRYQEELIAARQKAERSDRLKSAFLANISHEIRTPMNGILGFSELLDEVEHINDTQKRYIKIIQDSGNRMLSLINDLIDISKIESQQVEISYSELDVSLFMNEILDFFSHLAEKKGLHLRMTREHRNTRLVTDKKKLHQILTNLIHNAIKFTHSGEIHIHVEQDDRKDWHFLCTDTGIGIAEDALNKIFDRFARENFLDVKNSEGAGLGLAISRGLAELLGGSISVESVRNSGTTFHVTIPHRSAFLPDE